MAASKRNRSNTAANRHILVEDEVDGMYKKRKFITDDWRGYDGLADLDYEKHFRVNYASSKFVKGNGNHINCIESFAVMLNTIL